MDWLWPAIAALSLSAALFALGRWRVAAREANTDSLTGLANRRGGRSALEREVQRARRYGRPLSVIVFDIDRFKAVNDRHGHPAGDRVLRAIGQAASDAARDTDQVVRWGGEEFLVICAESGRAEACRLAERLRRRIARLHHGRRRLNVTASFGVSTFIPGEDANALAARADQALYRAKRAGRNRVVALPAADQPILIRNARQTRQKYPFVKDVPIG